MNKSTIMLLGILAGLSALPSAADAACTPKDKVTLVLESNGQGDLVGLGCFLQPHPASKDLCAISTSGNNQHTFTFEILNNCTAATPGNRIEVQAYLSIPKGALGFSTRECGDGTYDVSLPLGPIGPSPMRQPCRTRPYKYEQDDPVTGPVIRRGEYHIYFTRVTERRGMAIVNDYLLPTPVKFDPQIAVERAGNETTGGPPKP